MKKTILIICVIFGCFSCWQNIREKDSMEIPSKELADTHTAENSLDYWGTYTGTLPSASGEGVETTLILRKDHTYILQSVYLGKEENKFEEKGSYSVESNLLTLSNSKQANQYFKMGENQLTKLDGDRQLIKGTLADQYILKKK